ncbi:MAG TPA: hypothetical protein VGG48_14140 [Rhizomicrobium sp.]|jgi:hypothetical protein
MTSPARRHLPDVLQIAFDAAGIDAAVRLAELLGGKSIYVPKKAGPSHALVVAGGRKAADAIMAAYHSTRIQFPKGGNLVRHIKAAEVLAAEGGSLSKAVDASGLHTRSISRLRKRIKAGEEIAASAVKAPSKKRDTRQIDIEDLL